MTSTQPYGTETQKCHVRTQKRRLVPLHRCDDEKDRDRKCENYTINVVIDTTSWGFVIGEVEILVKTPEEVEDAVKQIEEMANKLDFKSAKKGGKLINYLQTHRPCAYNTYIETFKSTKT